MTDEVRFSVLRRKLVAGLGTGAIGGVTASAVTRAAPASAQESKCGALVPWILVSSMIRCSSGTWRRCSSGYSAAEVGERMVYAADLLLGSNNPGRGPYTHKSLIYRRPC